jgi:hypothetical protein
MFVLPNLRDPRHSTIEACRTRELNVFTHDSQSLSDGETSPKSTREEASFDLKTLTPN